jgi:hypothetical protein
MMRRLRHDELFRIGPTGLEEISDETLNRRLDAVERAELERMANDRSQEIPE